MSRDLSYETDSGPKTKTVSDPNFQVTPTATTATATARRQLSHLARPLDHHAQGANIPIGVNPSLQLKNDILPQGPKETVLNVVQSTKDVS